MYEYLIIIGVILLTGAIGYIIIRNPYVNNELNQKRETTPNSIDEIISEPTNISLSENTYIQISKYNDKKQDSRTDAILQSIDTIKFWVRIIGIYFLIKIIMLVIETIALIRIGVEFNEILLQIL